MNSLRKSSKSLKRFINTKAKDHGIKVPTKSRAVKEAAAPAESAAPTTAAVDKKSVETAGKPLVEQAAKPKVKKAPAPTPEKTPAADAVSVESTKRPSNPATKNTKTISIAPSEQPVVAKKKTIVRKKVVAKPAPASGEAPGEGQSSIPKSQSAVAPAAKQGKARAETTAVAPTKASNQGKAKVEGAVATKQPAKGPINKPTLVEASTKSTASKGSAAKSSVQRPANDTASVQSKASSVNKQRAAAAQKSCTTATVQSKPSTNSSDTTQPNEQASSSPDVTLPSDQSSVSSIKQRAAALQQSSTASLQSTRSKAATSKPSTNKAEDDESPQEDGSVSPKQTNPVINSTSQSNPSSIKQRAAALQQQSKTAATKPDTNSVEPARKPQQDEHDAPKPHSPDSKPKSSSSSTTSVTASIHSGTSRGSPEAKATAAKAPPQRAYSSSAVSLTRSGNGLPPRATKLKPTLRPIDHDETSTIATTFTTPISYVEFSAENESKLHLPNDDGLDATMKLLVCDLHSSEPETVQKSMEALRATDAATLVSLQSALPILLVMRRWLTDANIQISGLQILQDTASDHLEFCQTAVSYGALQVCLAALQNHPRHSLVQKHACGALVQLVVADAHAFVLNLDGVQIVTKTAVPHAPKYVVFLLQYLSYWQDEFKTKLVRDGGLQALAEIVEGSSGNLHKAAKATMQRLL